MTRLKYKKTSLGLESLELVGWDGRFYKTLITHDLDINLIVENKTIKTVRSYSLHNAKQKSKKLLIDLGVKFNQEFRRKDHGITNPTDSSLSNHLDILYDQGD